MTIALQQVEAKRSYEGTSETHLLPGGFYGNQKLTRGTPGSILRIKRLLVNIREPVRPRCSKDAIAMLALQKADSALPAVSLWKPKLMDVIDKPLSME